MLKNHLAAKILEKLNYSPTQGQDSLIGRISDFVMEDEQENIMLIKGYAGTGKTTVISALVNVFDELKIKYMLLAPTGRAAKVLCAYSGKQAYTMHKKIYRQKSSKDGFGTFVLEKNLHTRTLFIIDEASMISNTAGENTIFGSGRLLDDLIEYVYNEKGCRLMLIGDTAQLPPVGISISPALDMNELQNYRRQVTEIFLSDIIRQAAGSGILVNATLIRGLITNRQTYFPHFQLGNYSDITAISGADLLETLSGSYDKYGIGETIVLCRSNKRANRYNEGIRKQILWREDELNAGDQLMVVKNNYFWLQGNQEVDFIANGDIVEVTRIKGYENLYGFRFADVTLHMSDYDLDMDAKILLDTLSVNSPSLPSEYHKKLFYAVADDYSGEKTKRKQYEKVRNDPYFNALQVKYAYAVTCHKAQGGQWKSVFIDQGYVTEDNLDVDYLRWLYTAFTRAVEKLYLVNFSERFFESD